MKSKNNKNKKAMMSQLLRYLLWGVFLSLCVLGVYFLAQGLKLI